MLVGKNPPANAGDMEHRFDLWVGKIPWRRTWQAAAVYLPGKAHGQRSLLSMGLQRVGHDIVTKQQQTTTRVGKGDTVPRAKIFKRWSENPRTSGVLMSPHELGSFQAPKICYFVPFTLCRFFPYLSILKFYFSNMITKSLCGTFPLFS